MADEIKVRMEVRDPSGKVLVEAVVDQEMAPTMVSSWATALPQAHIYVNGLMVHGLTAEAVQVDEQARERQALKAGHEDLRHAYVELNKALAQRFNEASELIFQRERKLVELASAQCAAAIKSLLDIDMLARVTKSMDLARQHDRDVRKGPAAAAQEDVLHLRRK